MLRGIAEACKQELRAGDLIGRYGGEEFVIVLPQSSSRQAEACGERICRHIACVPFHCGDETVHVTASIGVCGTDMLSKQAITADRLIQLADEALYTAKHRGKTASSSGYQRSPSYMRLLTDSRSTITCSYRCAADRGVLLP